MSDPARVTLRGVLDRTASWASIGLDGGLVVELYDFSPDAHAMLGNDVAFLLHVAADDKERVVDELLRERGAEAAGSGDADAALLRLLQERFDDYYAFKAWLEQHAIPHRKEFEPWA